MVTFGDEEENNVANGGDFSIETDLKVFIDMGHDTLKAAAIANNDWNSQLNHFEVPTVIIPELHHTQVELMKQSPYEFDKRRNTSFKFFKQNVETLTERVLNKMQQTLNMRPSDSFHQRPMINGLIRKGKSQDKEQVFIDSFEFMWEHIGRMFVQGMEGTQEDIHASWNSVHSRLLMTDPSLTMAANDSNLISLAQKQRQKIAEIVFESLGIQEFSLQPAQLPMMISELCMDGIVVDLGHEMTQIVPIYGGMTDIRKSQTFKVGGITMDSILMNLWNDDQIIQRSKYIHYRTRTKFKEELPKLRAQAYKNQAYVLPDGNPLTINWMDQKWREQEMHPIRCYLDLQYYKNYYDDVIIPLFQGSHRTKYPLQQIPRTFSDEAPNPNQNSYPLGDIEKQTLRNKVVDGRPHYPLTDHILKAMRQYCEDEEIKEFDQLQNIIICGGGANINEFSDFGAKTLGELLTVNLKQAIADESVTGLNVILSLDPRLAILQGARILMNLSSNRKHYVSQAEYQEQGSSVINQILI